MSSSPLSANQIRQQFLDYFASKGHRIVASSPLVPGNDPTLMFTNSGMVQFKDTFLGADKRDYTRAATAQRCVRAGGKHNDLENVGYTARHHTFFEMLGNFSFGDYFKRDAIVYAWELLTTVYGLPADKLWVTVYHTDDEAYDLWHHTVGVPADRIIRIGDNKGAPYASDNFWQMADTGPCGPCSEIFYDHGEGIYGGPPGSPEEDGDRYIEIWNLVFMQFERHPDGSLTKLPAPCVDTGMGLERLTAVLQHVHSNYEIDLFQHLIRAASAATGCTDLDHPSLKVIADHLRATSFLIVDGVLPSNEGRGYVLRRIIRRALRHGWKLGRKEPFFAGLVPALVAQMGAAYPELVKKQSTVTQALHAEEVRFGETLDTGMRVFEEFTDPLTLAINHQAKGRKVVLGPTNLTNGNFKILGCSVGTKDNPIRVTACLVESNLQLSSLGTFINLDGELVVVISDGVDHTKTEHFSDLHANTAGKLSLNILKLSELKIPGQAVFKLYDTYGFPADLTADIARERGLAIDDAGFQAEMDKQRERAREASKFGGGIAITAEQVAGLPATQFRGYGETHSTGLRVLKILVDGKEVPELISGDSAVVILDATPFYAESGGQVGDTGSLDWDDGRFEVRDTLKLAGTFHGHVGALTLGRLQVGQVLSASADGVRRTAIKANHSATHLLHAALRQVLGEHVTQKGSLVAPDRLRFDFSHFQPVTREQQRQIERLVNAEIQGNAAVDASEMGYDDAIAAGAMALFGEKYGDRVRVLQMGGFSTELCGGTHVSRTGDIGVFKILSEGGVASGIRRIEAVTAAGALAHLEAAEDRLREIGQRIGGSGDDVVGKLDALLARQKQLERELDQLKAKAAGAGAKDLAAQAVDVGGFKFLAARVEGVEAKALRDMVDQLKADLGDAAVLLAGARDGKVNLIAGVSGAALGKVKAGDLLSEVARQIGGKGGGRPDLAQGGGDDVPQLAQVLAQARAWVQARV